MSAAAALLERFRSVGIAIDVIEGRKLRVAPASELTADERAVIRSNLKEIVALLEPTQTQPLACHGANRLARDQDTRPAATGQADLAMPRDEADRCHAGGWDDTEIARFIERRDRLERWGWDERAAEAMAERLTLRDRDADDRVICGECRHYRPSRCGNHRLAGLQSPDMGHDLATRLQRCPGFES